MDSRRQNDLKPLREILPLEASIFFWGKNTCKTTGNCKNQFKILDN